MVARLGVIKCDAARCAALSSWSQKREVNVVGGLLPTRCLPAAVQMALDEDGDASYMHVFSKQMVRARGCWGLGEGSVKSRGMGLGGRENWGTVLSGKPLSRPSRSGMAMIVAATPGGPAAMRLRQKVLRQRPECTRVEYRSGVLRLRPFPALFPRVAWPWRSSS